MGSALPESTAGTTLGSPLENYFFVFFDYYTLRPCLWPHEARLSPNYYLPRRKLK